MPKQYSSPPAMQIDPKKTYRAVMNTSKGAINIDLFADRAPISVNNFVFLAQRRLLRWRYLPPCAWTDSWRRAATPPAADAADPVIAGMTNNRLCASRMMRRAPSAWRTPDPTPTAHNSSSLLYRRRTSTATTLYSGASADADSMKVLNSLQRIDPQRPNPSLSSLINITSIAVEEA